MDVDREVAGEPITGGGSTPLRAAGQSPPALPLRLPRKNGELVFRAPWEGRAFGMAVALRQSRRYAWPDFQRHLEREIAAAGPADDGTHYYERWLAAFEALLAERGLVDRAELGRRTHEYLDGVRDDVF